MPSQNTAQRTPAAASSIFSYSTDTKGNPFAEARAERVFYHPTQQKEFSKVTTPETTASIHPPRPKAETPVHCTVGTMTTSNAPRNPRGHGMAAGSNTTSDSELVPLPGQRQSPLGPHHAQFTSGFKDGGEGSSTTIPVLAQYVQRFREGEAQDRSGRQLTGREFWWLRQGDCTVDDESSSDSGAIDVAIHSSTVPDSHPKGIAVAAETRSDYTSSTTATASTSDLARWSSSLSGPIASARTGYRASSKGMHESSSNSNTATSAITQLCNAAAQPGCCNMLITTQAGNCLDHQYKTATDPCKDDVDDEDDVLVRWRRQHRHAVLVQEQVHSSQMNAPPTGTVRSRPAYRHCAMTFRYPRGAVGAGCADCFNNHNQQIRSSLPAATAEPKRHLNRSSDTLSTATHAWTPCTMLAASSYSQQHTATCTASCYTPQAPRIPHSGGHDTTAELRLEAAAGGHAGHGSSGHSSTSSACAEDPTPQHDRAFMEKSSNHSTSRLLGCGTHDSRSHGGTAVTSTNGNSSAYRKESGGNGKEFLPERSAAGQDESDEYDGELLDAMKSRLGALHRKLSAVEGLLASESV